ncbi:MAG: winged helix-turn-helix transcriptional regulator [Alphaproteobacteria bacterium]
MSDSYKNVPHCDTLSHNEESCRPVREILNIVGNKWSILIVALLEDGTKRFSELQRNVDGISQRMLTRTLRELERHGMLSRKVEPTVPPSVYYTLTPLGESLLAPAKALAFWAHGNYPEIQAAQKAYDKKEASEY